MIPGSASPHLLGAAAGGGAYQISRSLRFNSADTVSLSRTPTVTGNRTTWTWASWVKLAGGTTNCVLLEAATDVNNRSYIALTGGNRLVVANIAGAATVANVTLARLLRDTAAWYHIVVSATTSTLSVYINGELQTAFSTNAQPGGQNWSFNLVGLAHRIGNAVQIGSPIPNGYLADVHWIDGQALTASSFGQFDATTGEWTPIAYTGTYGTNGFRLDFSDNSGTTATTLGADRSGNGNNWTPTNFSVAAGSGNDSMVDTPTSYGTDTGVGGEVRGNYATLNPINTDTGTKTNGNLDFTTAVGASHIRANIGITSGKWYWEVAGTTNGGNAVYGIVKEAAIIANFVGADSNGWGYSGDGTKQANGSATYATGFSTEVIGVAFDADAGTLVFYRNGASQGTAFTGLTSGPYFPAVSDISTGSSTTGWINFGQRPFAYTAPSGFKALCDTNLTAPTITKPSTVMDVKLYTGNGSTQTISGLGFSPDLVWVKCRSVAEDHNLYDAVRGATKLLYSSATNAEYTDATSLTAFDPSGFTFGSGTNSACNANGRTYAAWCWDAGSSTVTNTAGTISSQVRANASAGFSIVTWTGNATTGATVGHGLGVAPQFIIVKNRPSITNWSIYHVSLGATKRLKFTTEPEETLSIIWNNTVPGSSVFTIGSSSGVNENTSSHVAYCFTPVAGYSAFGSYTGNGNADGPFVYTGFRPRWVLIKCSSTGGVGYDWVLYDTTRATYNETKLELYPNDPVAEGANGGPLDITSNGFKVRGTRSVINTSTATCIYAAFAEFPFQFSRAR